jgi:NAD(P)-dependent dehydrogenase (short-subunit alcohol dehydrogenase family)
MSNISVDLTGQVAAVTGAGNGIGKACALALASSGAQIALLDISASAMEQTQQEIADLGGSSTAYVCDVSKVGHMTKACIPPAGTRQFNMGIPKAAVLPVPVRACPMTSCPSKARGIV